MWDIRPLLTFNFWLNTNPPPLLPLFEKLFFIVYICALLVALALGIWERRVHDLVATPMVQKVRRLATTLGASGLLLSFFAYERTPVLSMRLFTLLLWGWIIIWAGTILWWRLRAAPRIVKTVQEQKTFAKYLPR